MLIRSLQVLKLPQSWIPCADQVFAGFETSPKRSRRSLAKEVSDSRLGFRVLIRSYQGVSNRRSRTNTGGLEHPRSRRRRSRTNTGGLEQEVSNKHRGSRTPKVSKKEVLNEKGVSNNRSQTGGLEQTQGGSNRRSRTNTGGLEHPRSRRRRSRTKRGSRTGGLEQTQGVSNRRSRTNTGGLEQEISNKHRASRTPKGRSRTRNGSK